MAFFISFGRLSLTLGSLLLCVLHGIFMSLVVRFMILAQFWIVGRFLDWLLFHGFFVLDRCLECFSVWSIDWFWPMVWMHQHVFVFYGLRTHHMAMHLYWLTFGSFLVSARLWRASLLSLEPWSCCFMILLVSSLFNIWPHSIVDFGPSLHFFWISSLILDILVFLVLCFCSWWISHVDKLPSWMDKRCASVQGWLSVVFLLLLLVLLSWVIENSWWLSVVP